jgi:hypothetical protein
LDLHNPNGGAGFRQEHAVQTSVNGSIYDSTEKYFTDGDTLSWRFASGPTGTLEISPALLLLGVGPAANTLASIPGVPEFVVPNSLSIPAATGLTFTLGDGFGLAGLLAPDLGPIGPNFTNSAPASFVWPAGSPFVLSDGLRLQGFVPDSGTAYLGNPIGGYSTNSAVLKYRPAGCDGSGFEGISTVAGSYPVGWAIGPGGTATDQWQPRSGGTPSAGTGPSSAYAGTIYMYCETSGAANTWPKTFVMDSAPLNTCGNPTPTLFFGYHMAGTTVGTLTVQTIDGAGFPLAIVFTATGSQGNNWRAATVPVTPTGGTVRLRFTYVTPAANNSFLGDAAIDDVFIL